MVAGAGLVSAGAGRWSLVQDWYLLVQEGGHWSRTGSCWCRKVVAGSGLVVAGVCWCRTGNRCCRKVAGSGLVSAGAELVSAGAELVSAGAERWSPMQDR